MASRPVVSCKGCSWFLTVWPRSAVETRVYNAARLADVAKRTARTDRPFDGVSSPTSAYLRLSRATQVLIWKHRVSPLSNALTAARGA
jgi:hypothetical protein